MKRFIRLKNSDSEVSGGPFRLTYLLWVLLALVVCAPLARAQQYRVQSYRTPQPALEIEGAGTWINTNGPLSLRDLRGKFVILDFWTYCCINCMHMLPELKKLEQAYPNELVVIGVHSAKFLTEQDTENIREAVMRYDIEHPVINDANHVLWRAYGVDVWPTLKIIDPEGRVIGGHEGEITFQALDEFLKRHVAVYRRRGMLDERPVHFQLEKLRAEPTPLRFPGKVLADAERDRLFIADTAHHRIVITTLDGQLIDVVGTGQPGAQDGAYHEASFDNPQGMAIEGDRLFVADTENHLVRQIDLKERQVTTIAGTGQQLRQALRRGGTRPRAIDLASPWALYVYGDQLYIAMAGVHQIWSLSLDGSYLGPYAGNGIEDIVDGIMLPRVPYQLGYASFAQPSGLASDGKWLFVADSEGSSIRAMPLDRVGNVITVLGTAALPARRLFTFGDRDGLLPQALLQHPLEVAYQNRLLFVADTYNNKVKVIDLDQRTIRTLVGGPAGADEGVAPSDARGLDEPGGLSLAEDKLYIADTNHHRIVVVDLKQPEQLTALTIDGLEPPAAAVPAAVVPPVETVEAEPFAAQAVAPQGQTLPVAVRLEMPPGYKLNPGAPVQYWIRAGSGAELLAPELLAKPQRTKSTGPLIELELPLSGQEGTIELTLGVDFYYCREGAEGLCRAAQVAWTGTLQLDSGAPNESLQLSQRVVPK